MIASYQKTILVVGNIRTGEYERLIEKNYRLLLLGDISTLKNSINNDLFYKIYFTNLKMPNADFISTIQKISNENTIDAVICLREYFISAHKLVTFMLGFDENSGFTINSCLDKGLMKKVFSRQLGANILPKYIEINSSHNLSYIVENFEFPVIIKPRKLYGSLFVKKVDKPEDLFSFYEKLKNKLGKYLHKNQRDDKISSTILVEEYLEGSVHSIDGIVDKNKQIYLTPVVDVITGRDIGVSDFGHRVRYTPTFLKDDDAVHGALLVKQGVEALNLKKSAFHAEFIVTKKGLRLLEIAARPGGHRNYLLRKAYGFDLNYEYIQMLEGNIPNFKPIHSHPFFIVTPSPQKETEFQGIRCVDFITQKESFHTYKIKANCGDKIGPASLGYMSSFDIELFGCSAEIMLNEAIEIAKYEGFFNENSFSSPESIQKNTV